MVEIGGHCPSLAGQLNGAVGMSNEGRISIGTRIESDDFHVTVLDGPQRLDGSNTSQSRFSPIDDGEFFDPAGLSQDASLSMSKDEGSRQAKATTRP